MLIPNFDKKIIFGIGTGALILAFIFQNCGTKFQTDLADSSFVENQGAGPTRTVTPSSITIDLSDLDEKMTNKTDATFTFTVTPVQFVKKIRCQIDLLPPTDCVNSSLLTGLAEGRHVFKLIVTDMGDQNHEVERGWTIDVTAPQMTLNQVPGGSTNQVSSTLIFSASDGSSGVRSLQCRLPNELDFQDCTSPLTIQNNPNQNHEVQFRTVDQAGNISGIQVARWQHLSQIPTVSIESAPPPFTKLQSHVFRFSGFDAAGRPLQKLSCSFNGVPYVDCSSGILELSFAAGPHSFRVRGEDSAGNFSAPIQANWTVDLVPPTISSLTGPVNCTAGTCASLAYFPVSDTQSGVASIRCSLNSGAFVDCTSPFFLDIPITMTGPMKLTVQAFDRVGHESTRAINWTVSPPSAAVTEFSSSMLSLRRGQTATLRWGTSNTTRVTLNQEDVPLNGTKVVTPTQSTMYTLTAIGAANSAAPVQRQIYLSVTEPPASIAIDHVPAKAARPGTNVSVSVQVLDQARNWLTGVKVNWSSPTPGVEFSPNCSQDMTSGAGHLTCIVKIGPNLGPNIINASVDGLAAVATTTITGSAVARLEMNVVYNNTIYTSGWSKFYYPAGQQFIGWAVAVDEFGNRISGIPIDWTLTKLGETSTLCPNSQTIYSTQSVTANCGTTLPTVVGETTLTAKYQNFTAIAKAQTVLPVTVKIHSPEYTLRPAYPGSSMFLGLSALEAGGEPIYSAPFVLTTTTGGTQVSPCDPYWGHCPLTLAPELGINRFVASSPPAPNLTFDIKAEYPVSLTSRIVFGETTYKVNSTIDMVDIDAIGSTGISMDNVPVEISTSPGASVVSCSKDPWKTPMRCTFKVSSSPGENTFTIKHTHSSANTVVRVNVVP